MMSTRNLRPKKARRQTAKAAAGYATPIPPMTISSGGSSSSSAVDVKKPMRPLTAYHIFFQIEREFIIQTTAGPDADKSIHANKSYLADVPRRYRKIKLLPDWYAGPGKRQKRKHRKSHGKIGFLELSRVISKRWATLESSDPETKAFVARIAAQELDVYKIEMRQYKELTEGFAVSPTAPRTPQPVTSSMEVGAMISPSSSPRPAAYVDPQQFYVPVDDVLSLERDLNAISQGSADDVESPPTEEIDYSICSVSNSGHYLPSPPGPEHAQEEACDPIFELEDGYNRPSASANSKRCVSPVVSSMNVEIGGETDIFKLFT